MIAYPKTLLELRAMRSLVQQAADRKLITPPETENILKAYPDGSYSPGLFPRIGFGLLTLIASLATAGLIALVSDFKNQAFLSGLMVLISFLLLEYFVRTKKHFHSGVDDVLLHTGILYLLWLFDSLGLFPYQVNDVLLFGLAAALYAFAAIRYIDRLAAGLIPLALGMMLLNAFDTVITVTPLPFYFVAAIVMTLIFIISLRLRKLPLAAYHQDCFQWLEISAIIACYASLHYHTLQINYFSTTDPKAGAKALINGGVLGYFSLAWTICFPIVLLWVGLKQKRRDWIRLGIIGLLSLAWFKHYYFPVFSSEITLILCGTAITISAALLISYLRKAKGSFTDDAESNDHGLQVIGPLAGWLTLPQGGQASSETRFGGGNFGGAGAGSEF